MYQETDSLLTPAREVLSVGELNRQVRRLLESSLSVIWVEGEISNLARPGSGHLYFSLKDAEAQVRCALFRNRAQWLDFTPANGLKVIARVRVGLYEPRGEFQLVVEQMSEAGDGALQRAFDALKKRLATEGLFDPERKRPLPCPPRRLGVITSPSGAAVRDVISVLRRRFAAIPLLIYPVAVQGKSAPSAIVQALETANHRAECDALLLTRGGGSLEDLWAFNDENVARAIFASQIPVVSAVGHEIDFSISDFVADRRAATPSAAAELLSPDGAEWRRRLETLHELLRQRLNRLLIERRRRLQTLQARLQHPRRRLELLAQRLDEQEGRLHRAMQWCLRGETLRLESLGQRLRPHDPGQRLRQLRTRFEHLAERLLPAWRHQLESRRARLELLSRTLDTVSPLATLQRGYAIITRADTGQLVRRAEQIQAGDMLNARLAEGRLTCRVEETD